MLLSSTHDFYLGRGPDAEWLGSVHLGDRACSGLSRLNGATTADEFDDLVLVFLNGAEVDQLGHVTFRGDSWPWPWPTSHGTDYRP